VTAIPSADAMKRTTVQPKDPDDVPRDMPTDMEGRWPPGLTPWHPSTVRKDIWGFRSEGRSWCEGPDSNRRTSAGTDLESVAFGRRKLRHWPSLATLARGRI